MLNAHINILDFDVLLEQREAVNAITEDLDQDSIHLAPALDGVLTILDDVIESIIVFNTDPSK